MDLRCPGKNVVAERLTRQIGEVMADYTEEQRPTKVGIGVVCTVCRRQKQPHGRSAPPYSSYCDRECEGYEQEPLPGCLWPREADADFGYPCCDNATAPLAERKEG